MSTLLIRIVDSNYKQITEAKVQASSPTKQTIRLVREEDYWSGQSDLGDLVTVQAVAKGYEAETHTITMKGEINQVVIALRRQGQISYNYGDDRLAFSPVNDAFLIRVRGTNATETFAKIAKKQELKWSPVLQKGPIAPDDLFARVAGSQQQERELSQELSRAKLTTEIARVIEHGERPALGLTNELIVRFHDDVKRQEAERIVASAGLKIARELLHAGNAFVAVREGEPSYDLLKSLDVLLQTGRVVYAEPNLTFAIEPDVYIPNDTLWTRVPHLQLIDVDDAWDMLDDVAINLRGGSPNITIGVIDPDGVTPNHPDLTANLTDGTSKLISSTNFAISPIAAQTVAGLGGDHGTQCAGSATAAFDNLRGIPGVAPNCHLIGARIGSVANTVLMADIYLWVGGFLNGSVTPGFPAALPTRPADVISSSFGLNGLAFSNTIRDCFDFLTTYGRGGKGCVLCFSLGNNGHVDFTNPMGARFRAWPTYEKTLGIGASINVSPTNPVNSFHADPGGNTVGIATSVDTRALYSPFGATALRKPDLVAPSHTTYDTSGTVLIDPIMSAVRVGTGGVNGCIAPATCNDYAGTFGGTSHATPVVAGAVALILSARPELNWVQVRDVLRQSCVRIDAAQANAIGAWQDLDGDTLIDYSRWYGAGRLDVDAAIRLALDPSLPLADVYVRENLADTGTVPSGGAWWASPDIWVRQNAATPIPALTWSDPAPHENARRGQDNAVFCRVRNRGTAAATVVYVRAMITHWAGLEFVYPDDFQPSNNVGAPIPNPLLPGTYLIGEARIDNLAPGADQIVKFNWPQALIPPETVTVGMATVHWHPCLLVEASPHDGPNPIWGLTVPLQGNNNIAQRNIEIINAGDSSADSFVGMIAGTRSDAGVATLLIDATYLREADSIRVHIADEAMMKKFWQAAQRISQERPIPGRPSPKPVQCAVIVEQRTRLRLDCGECDVIIEAAPGSRILSCDCHTANTITTQWVKHQNVDAVEIKGLRGQIEIPLRIPGGQFVPLLVAVTGAGSGDLQLTQRRGDGEMSPGYGIRFLQD